MRMAFSATHGGHDPSAVINSVPVFFVLRRSKGHTRVARRLPCRYVLSAKRRLPVRRSYIIVSIPMCRTPCQCMGESCSRPTKSDGCGMRLLLRRLQRPLLTLRLHLKRTADAVIIIFCSISIIIATTSIITATITQQWSATRSSLMKG